MINLEPKRGGKVKVTFRVTDAVADGDVSVVGDFNDWTPGATPLKSRGEARIASVSLPAGQRYAFRYLGEGGRWFNDDGAHDYEANEFGGMNGVIDAAAAPPLDAGASLEQAAELIGDGPSRSSTAATR